MQSEENSLRPKTSDQNSVKSLSRLASLTFLRAPRVFKVSKCLEVFEVFQVLAKLSQGLSATQRAFSKGFQICQAFQHSSNLRDRRISFSKAWQLTLELTNLLLINMTDFKFSFYLCFVNLSSFFICVLLTLTIIEILRNSRSFEQKLEKL